MELRWIASRSAAGVYSAGAVWQGRTLLDATLQEAIEQPAKQLREGLVAAGIDPEEFITCLIPNAARIESNTQLIEVTLHKLPSYRPTMLASPGQLTACVADLELAIDRMDSKFADKLLELGRPLHNEWETRGKTLPGRIGQLTDPMLTVSRAEVILVPATVGGGSRTFLDHNSVAIETADPNSEATLPEVARLAWMLMQLNLDLPMFSEEIFRRDLPQLADLAMISPTLSAAIEAGLIEAAPDDACPLPMAQAIESWNAKGPPHIDGREVDLVEVTTRWWAAYTQVSLRWESALGALYCMLTGRESLTQHTA